MARGATEGSESSKEERLEGGEEEENGNFYLTTFRVNFASTAYTYLYHPASLLFKVGADPQSTENAPAVGYPEEQWQDVVQ